MDDTEFYEPAPPLRRMIIAVMAMIGLLIATYMFLYKLGIIRTIACGTGSCARVQSSPWAVFLGVPVPLIGVLGYLSILVVAVLGLQPRWIEHRFIPLALIALTTIAFVFSMYLSYVEAFLIHDWCRYCIASAVVASAMFIAALFEIPVLRKGSV